MIDEKNLHIKKINKNEERKAEYCTKCVVIFILPFL